MTTPTSCWVCDGYVDGCRCPMRTPPTPPPTTKPQSKDHPMTSYDDFLKGKVRFNEQHGFPVDSADIHPILKPHQKAIVQWAVQGGRRGRAVELNHQYFLDGVKYLEAEERKSDLPTLFDLFPEAS